MHYETFSSSAGSGINIHIKVEFDDFELDYLKSEKLWKERKRPASTTYP